MSANRHPEPRSGSTFDRRKFIQVGLSGAVGLSLTDLLRAESGTSNAPQKRSVINIHLDGGMPQMDTIDPKPDAPIELRGEFESIATTIPGVRFSEMLPRLASMADRLSIIRSVTGSVGKHDGFQCQSGFGEKDLESFGGRPAFGSVVAKLEGSPNDTVPGFIDLMQGRPLARNSARPGFLGPSFKPFRPDLSKMFQRELEDGMKGELARLGEEHQTELTLNPALTMSRIQRRQSLRKGLDRLKHEIDRSGMMGAMDEFSQQAVGILTSGQLATALDLDQEEQSVLERYSPSLKLGGEQFRTAEGSDSIKKFLMARRLIEAGARVVTISLSDFDTHSANYPRMRNLLPILDYGLATLIDDLAERGLLETTTVVAWGEFGRTPKINDKGGRDHWPAVGPAILCGGELGSGRVIGKTDRSAAKILSRPVTYKEMLATIYHSLNINPHRITIDDPTGRPQYLLDEGEPIAELL